MMVWTKGEWVSDWEGERMSLYNCQYVTLYLYKMIQMKKTMNNAKENHCCANLFCRFRRRKRQELLVTRHHIKRTKYFDFICICIVCSLSWEFFSNMETSQLLMNAALDLHDRHSWCGSREVLFKTCHTYCDAVWYISSSVFFEDPWYKKAHINTSGFIFKTHLL